MTQLKEGDWLMGCVAPVDPHNEEILSAKQNASLTFIDFSLEEASL